MGSRKVELDALDVGYLAQFVGNSFAGEVQRRLAAAGFEGVRFGHGYVVQHLLAGVDTLGELAARMGVTQQAASKVVAEMETLGLLARKTDPADARIRRIQLTPRAEKMIAVSRQARAALQKRLEAKVGRRELEACRATLRELLGALGGVEAVQQRRTRPPQ